MFKILIFIYHLYLYIFHVKPLHLNFKFCPVPYCLFSLSFLFFVQLLFLLYVLLICFSSPIRKGVTVTCLCKTFVKHLQFLFSDSSINYDTSIPTRILTFIAFQVKWIKTQLPLKLRKRERDPWSLTWISYEFLILKEEKKKKNFLDS